MRTIRSDSHKGNLEHSLEEAAAELAETNLETVLDDVLIEPTFTAHPTEARQKTVKSKLRTIATALKTLDKQLLTEKEASQLWQDIDTEVTSLWQTPQVRNRQPESEDETRNVQWYLENTLFEFLSWAGSDRDGNPYITPDVTERTLERQCRVVIEQYHGDPPRDVRGVPVLPDHAR